MPDLDVQAPAATAFNIDLIRRAAHLLCASI